MTEKESNKSFDVVNTKNENNSIEKMEVQDENVGNMTSLHLDSESCNGQEGVENDVERNEIDWKQALKNLKIKVQVTFSRMEQNHSPNLHQKI